MQMQIKLNIGESQNDRRHEFVDERPIRFRSRVGKRNEAQTARTQLLNMLKKNIFRKRIAVRISKRHAQRNDGLFVIFVA